MMSRRSLANWSHAGIVVLHLLLIAAAYYAAFLFRFDFNLPRRYRIVFLETLPVLLTIRFVTFWYYRLYRSSWRHSGVADLVALVKAVTLSSAVFAALLLLLPLPWLRGFPRTILAADWAAAILLSGGVRMAFRVLREQPLSSAFSLNGGTRDWTPAVVVGAGDAGARLVRELRLDRVARVNPVAIVDDDAAKHHVSLHGVPVEGDVEALGDIAARYGARLAIIAVPSATREQVQRIVNACRRAKLQCQIVPSLPELLNGSARLSQLRDVQIDDLLGRRAVELDLSLAADALGGKVVLITGGAGSIGSELARQVAALRPARLVLLEQAESPLYFIHLEVSKRHPEVEVIPVMADVVNQARVDEVFAEYRPHCVFHAAAYKHVPLMEDNVVEAVRNNVFGTVCVAEHAALYGAEKFVLISTDKAVRPSSVMGATKRIAERVVLGLPRLARSSTDFRAVRFGNVLGSDGSVIPLFKRQLARGGPLTVTHPEVTRYFMTIPEAVQLVLLAGVLPEAAGRISMLEMGEPVRIKDLAENLIRLSGLEPGVDVEIRYTGLRPGEKLYEELMSAVEETVPTAVEKIQIVRTDEADGLAVVEGVARLQHAAGTGGQQLMLEAIVRLAPECVPPLRDRGRADQARPSPVHAPHPGQRREHVPERHAPAHKPAAARVGEALH
jgi:FlaA1/EpsC-like NDP-sugar epimerase